MVKHFFIPVVILLALVAGGMAYLFHTPRLETHDAPSQITVKRTTLTNGLEVIIVPIDRAPAITHMMVVKAGGGDDPSNLPGLAHFLEHLMFTGTQNHPEGDYDKLLSKLGAEHNAFTTYDYTAYYVNFAKAHLETVMQLEADRLQNLHFDDAKAAREKSVILEERRMRVETHPLSQLREQMRAVQFLAHPYRQPLIGWADAISRFTAKDAQAFYDRYYRASNMVLVIVGDVDAKQVSKLAASYYGALPSKPEVARSWPVEPKLSTKRSLSMVDKRAQQTRVLLSYLAPSLGAGDLGSNKASAGVGAGAGANQAKSGQQNIAKNFALEVLASYLGAPKIGVLYRALVRQQRVATAISVRANNWVLGPGRLEISMSVAQGVDAATAQAALDNALQQVMHSGLDANLLAQAKTILAAEAIYARDGLYPLATIMAELAALNRDETIFYQWQAGIKAVSAQSVLQLAEQILTQAPSVRGVLLPASPASATPAIVPIASLQSEVSS
jgi:zinc protease